MNFIAPKFLHQKIFWWVFPGRKIQEFSTDNFSMISCSINLQISHIRFSKSPLKTLPEKKLFLWKIEINWKTIEYQIDRDYQKKLLFLQFFFSKLEKVFLDILQHMLAYQWNMWIFCLEFFLEFLKCWGFHKVSNGIFGNSVSLG